MLHTQCGITETAFNYSIPAHAVGCGALLFNVTPVNEVGQGEENAIVYEPDEGKQNPSLFKLAVQAILLLFSSTNTKCSPESESCSWQLEIYFGKG